MKVLLTILLVLLGLMGFAQTPRPTGIPTQLSTGWQRWGYSQSDSGSIVATRDTNWIPRFIGTMIIWPRVGVDTSFYFWTGARWLKILRTGDTPDLSLYFKQNGNSYGTTATLGTNDNNPLVFKTNNIARGIITTDNKWGIGTTTPTFDLEVKNATGNAIVQISGPMAGSILDLNGSSSRLNLGGSTGTIQTTIRNTFIEQPSAMGTIGSYTWLSFLNLNQAQTSGNGIGILSDQAFTPSSGNATHTSFRIGGLINQTGGASGTTYGIRINPVITNAANFNALMIDTGYIVSNKGVLPTIGAIGTSYVMAFDTTDFRWKKILATNLPGGGGGSGVTSVGSGYGLLGGTITTTGTLLVDSSALSAYLLRRKDSLLLYVTPSQLRDSLIANAATLNNTQIGVGNGSNVLSGSAALLYNGTGVLQENSSAKYNLTSTTALGTTSGGGFYGYAKALPTAADQLLAIFGGGSQNASTSELKGASARIYSTSAWTAGSAQQSYFSVFTSSAATEVERFRVAHNGAVGIGASAPLASLDIIRAGTSGTNGSFMRWPLGVDQTTPQTGTWSYAALSSINRLAFVPTGNTYKRIPLMNDVTPAAGGILQGNATDFTLLTLGSANQLFRVNSGATAAEWFTPSYVTSNIYTADGTLSGNRIVTGSSANLTFASIGNYRINSTLFALSKADGTIPYTSFINGATGNILNWAYTPTFGVFSKGAAMILDTNNNVNIGSNSTSQPLYTTGGSLYAGQGFLSAAGNFYHVRNITTSASVALTDYFITIDATGGNVTLTLPAASSAFGATVGIQYSFKRIDSSGNTVTIQVNGTPGTDTIDGAANITLSTQYQLKEIQCISTIAWAIK